MTPRSRSARILGLVAWLALAFAAGAIGAVASLEAASFYSRLVRPSWAPPPAVFGPVWSILYAMMGVAAWLVWREGGRRHWALGLFGLQLVVNALWSWLFFVWRQGAFAFCEVLILVVLIGATVIAFWRVSRPAAVLMLPYLAWVCFASVLTWPVWQANPTLLK